MRKFVLASTVLALTAGITHASSFIMLDNSKSQQSMVEVQPRSTVFDLYGPSVSDCSQANCPSQAELEKLARKGSNVMKVAGGEIQMFEKVFAPMPKKTEKTPESEVDTEFKTASVEPESEKPTLDVLAAIDSYKTGPLGDGEKQMDIAGVDTEFLPDVTPEFEPELTSSIDDSSIVLENLSYESMSALSNAM